MESRTLGVEEELLLVDPTSRTASPRAQQVLKYAAEHDLPDREDLDHELYRHQLETRTPPAATLAELREHLLRRRALAAEAAAGVGLRTAASATIPLGGAEPRTTRDDRYLALVDAYGELARTGGTCGMHVHVEIASEEEGVRVLDALRPWLPVLLAISANSPFHAGRDTGYASWRTLAWGQLPSAGPTERFGSVAGYHRVGRSLIESGAARDEGMLYYDARLARRFPTVEVRIADVCTDPADAVLVAALARALVHHCAEPGAEPPGSAELWRAELVRAATWRAARAGLGGRLLDPLTARLRPAREVLGLLLDTVREPLAAYGDEAEVREGIERVLGEGGSVRQRAAYERSGRLEDVVDDLVARTNLMSGAG